jgi:hypothetical protein
MVERFGVGVQGKSECRSGFHFEAVVKRSVLFDHALPNGEAEEFGIVGEAEVLHDSIFVKGYGAGGYVQDGGGFFHGVAFGEEL